MDQWALLERKMIRGQKFMGLSETCIIKMIEFVHMYEAQKA